MKATLFVTQDCNLGCDYCYIGKRDVRMELSTARSVLDFIAARLLAGEKVDIGFFGGEPLLALPLVLDIAHMTRAHPLARGRRLELQLITNGTLLDLAGTQALREQGIEVGISCDGPPSMQNSHRRYRDGRPTAPDVERAIVLAVRELPRVMVNSVYRPDTIRGMPDAVSYFYALGVRNIFLGPDIAAKWTQADVEAMRQSYGEVADLYRSYYLAGDPARVSLIDAKIAVLLNGGYAPHERCSMGRSELAFGPEGAIYPCERLAGDCVSGVHRIGTVQAGRVSDVTYLPTTCDKGAGGGSPPSIPCRDCSIHDYCMHWCGCTNYFSTGCYDRPGPFLCASEKEALRQAGRVLASLAEDVGPDFVAGMSRHHSEDG